MCFFGGIGTWLFGEFRQDFASFSASMQTLFAMMFGSFIPGWTQSSITIVYTVRPLIDWCAKWSTRID
jgi:hypothetical protein